MNHYLELGNRVRLDQARRELEALSADIKGWIDRRQLRDNLKQYQTQLLTIKDFLLKSLSELRSALAGVSARQERGLVYLECRKFDKRLVVVRRVWEFFRVRFDQRDDPKLEKVLKSADEVVWSCYAGSFQQAANLTSVSRGTSPLPFIQPRFSPEAHTRNDPPPDLKSDVDLKFVQDFLMKLPVPVLGLPPACVESPWWLIFLGHEVGHHIQHDLLPNSGLLSSFGDLLRAGAATAEDGHHDSERWAKWNEEIFADIFSVLQLGPWASWAMAELEQADELTMLSGGKGRYPIPAVRMALLSHLNKELKVNGSSAELQLEPAELTVGKVLMQGDVNLREIVANDLKAVPALVKAALNQPVPALGEASSLLQLFGWQADEFKPSGKIAHRREALLGRAPLISDETLPAARLVISASVDAWIEVSAIDDDATREQARATLKSNLLEVLPKCREVGTRAATASQEAPVQNLGEEFASLLLQASTDQLGA
jgi:hypothetical protein